MDLLVTTLTGATPLDVSGAGWPTQLLALAGILATLVVLLRWWFQNRR